MGDFYELSVTERAVRLREMALLALKQYDLDVTEIRLMSNSANCVFRVVTTDGSKRVLRISDPMGCLSPAEIQSEMAWLAALGRDGLDVPQPVATRAGASMAIAEVADVPEARHCAIFSWVPGRNLSDDLTPANMSALGELSGQLHVHAQSFVPPEGFRVRTRDTVFPFSNPDFPYVEPIRLFDDEFATHITPVRRELFSEAAERIQGALDTLYADVNGLRVIHNDLHQWNVKVHKGKVYALDFENLMWGYPVQDVSTTLFYVRWHEQWEELAEAFQQGYTRVREWPEQYSGQIDILIGGHGLMLINYLLLCCTPEDDQLASDYLVRVEGHLRDLRAGSGSDPAP